MATTFVEIANRAITFLGGTTITALTDDTKEGRAVLRLYEQTRDQILRDHPWNFAIRRDANLFDAKFTEVYSLRLAADIAYDITASQTVAQTAETKYSALLQEARLIDAQESLSASEQSWLDARS